MNQQVRDFFKGAFALIALYLILAHAGGFAQSFGAATGGVGSDFKILQGR